MFCDAAVPYIIKPYKEIVKNPKDTIEFSHEWDAKINKRRLENGADGALLRDNIDGNLSRKFNREITCNSIVKNVQFYSRSWYLDEYPTTRMERCQQCFGWKWSFYGYALLFEKIFENFSNNY